MNKKITIICPIRNEEKYIGGCLDALAAQSYDHRRVEIFLIDGMSSDLTREIVQDYTRRNSNIFMVDNPSRTVPQAMNIGLQKANGDIIIRVDGHARISPDYVEKCVQYLKKIGADCVGGSIINVNDDPIGKAISAAMSSSFGVGNARFRISGKAGFVDTVAFGAYRKEVFQKIGNFDPELVRCQDDEFNYRLRKHGGKIFFSPEIKSFYYPRSTFAALWRQYFGYGYYKIRVLQKHFLMMQPRQFVPAAFTLSLIFIGMGAASSGYLLVVFLLMILTYLAANVIFSLILAKKKQFSLFFLIFLAFPIIHFAYGSGFLCGLVMHFPKWFKRWQE